MPVMNTKTLPLQLEYRDRAARAFYQEKADKYRPVWNKIFDEQTTDKAWVQDVSMGGLGPYKPAGEGESVKYDNLVEGMPATYVLSKFHLGFGLTEEAEWYGTIWPLLKAGTEAMAVSRMHSLEMSAADLINYGFVTDRYIGADGKAFFAADHPVLRSDAPQVSGSSTYRNRPALNHPVSEAGIEQAVIDIDSMTDESGFFTSVEADQIVVSKADRMNIARIQMSMGRVGTADNDVNALKALGLLDKQAIVWKYLQDPIWFIKTKGYSGDGLKAYRNRKADPTPKTWIDEATGDTLCRSRYAMAWGISNTRSVYASPGA